MTKTLLILANCYGMVAVVYALRILTEAGPVTWVSVAVAAAFSVVLFVLAGIVAAVRHEKAPPVSRRG